MAYNIGVIGAGYVGLVSGTCFAATGNTVYCVDIDETKINKLKSGLCPIFEPGLDRLLKRIIAEERLFFTTNIEEIIEKTSIIFLCLPTPPNEDGSADLQHVLKVAKHIAQIIKEKAISEKKIIVNKSTVPVGTSEKVKNIMLEYMPQEAFEVVSNPEFLREGLAVDDALKPERVVVGTQSKWVEEVMTELYLPFLRTGNPIIFMDEKSAEVTKYAANAFLATKISFMNDLTAYCEQVGADIDKIRFGIGSDSRIGKMFLFAGLGYGGSCFPKDVRALACSALSVGKPLKIVNATQDVNNEQIQRFFNKITNRFDNLFGLKFAIWGLAFKPNTDDTREAPAFRIIDLLLERGAHVIAHDPEAIDNTKLNYGDRIEYASRMYDTLYNCDALIIITEWNQFRTPDFDLIKSKLKNNIIFDGRNLYNLDFMADEGFEYYSIGRREVNANK